jgi:competence protein ComEC
LRYPIKKWAAVGAMLGALGYLLISGAAFATVRSYIMISIMFFAVLLDRPAVALRNVALAALAILLVWPESLFDPGFQMSFAAVVALVSVYEWLRTRQEERPEGSRRGLISHLLLFLGGIISRRWWRACRWHRSASTISTTRNSSRCSPIWWRSRSATCW